MSDYISRDELLELYAPDPDCDKCSVPFPVARQNILDMPAADVAPVRHGRWIPSDYTGDCCYTCSECGFECDAYLLDVGDYCPACGVKMDKEGKQMTEQQHDKARQRFADNFSYAVNKSGKSLREIARETGLSTTLLSNYKNDRAEAGIDKLTKLADYFNVSADWLLGRTDMQEIYDGGEHMTGNEYQCLALRTVSSSQPCDHILNGVTGLNGEAGECIDIVKKHLFQGHPLDTDKLVDELGDVLWYVAITADGIGVPLEDIMQHNIDKLRKRYPDGFNAERSIHREDNE